MFPEPKSPYAVTKLDGEYYCKMFSDEGWLETASLRYFNVFGPRQDPASQYAAAIPIFVHKALRNEPITIFGDGQQTRDFVFVKDIVAANVHMAMTKGPNSIYNVAYGKSITIQKLAEDIISITGSKSKIKHVPERAGDVKHSLAATDQLDNTGFMAGADFEKGLKQTVEFFRDEFIGKK